MLRIVLFNTFIILISCVTNQVCYESGYQNCLDQDGKCTTKAFNCSTICFSNNDCPKSCCQDSYCVNSKHCEDNFEENNIFIVAIVLPLVGALILFLSIIFCILRNQRKIKVAKNLRNSNADSNQAVLRINDVTNQQSQSMIQSQQIQQSQKVLNKGEIQKPILIQSAFLNPNHQQVHIQQLPMIFIQGVPCEKSTDRIQVETQSKKRVNYIEQN